MLKPVLKIEAKNLVLLDDMDLDPFEFLVNAIAQSGFSTDPEVLIECLQLSKISYDLLMDATDMTLIAYGNTLTGGKE